MPNKAEYREINKQLHADIDYKLLGRHLREIRKQNGMTQAEIAEKMKMGVKYYASIEEGKTKINLIRLIQFICITQTSADYILAGTHKRYPSQFQCPENASRSRKQLSQLLDQCSEQIIETIYVIAEGLRNRE
ncbi:helix-turn-helix domain-containing protein [Faecalimonas sp.]